MTQPRVAPTPPSPNKQLWWCNLHHVINDGYIASLSLLLPFIAADLGLSYSQAGLLKTFSHGAISAAHLLKTMALIEPRRRSIRLIGPQAKPVGGLHCVLSGRGGAG